MPASNPFEPVRRPIAEEDGESFDSIPWEALQRITGPRDHRRWYALAAVIVAVAVGLSVIRTLGLADPGVVAASTTGPPSVPPTTAASTTTTLAAVVTEADLMAIEPSALERAAASFAEVAATEYFSGYADGVWQGVEFERTRSTFVELAAAVDVTSLGPGRHSVLVAVSVLDAAPDEPFVRRPLRGVTVNVEVDEGIFRPAGLPTPAELPYAPLERSADSDEVVVVVDDAGISWPMADDGTDVFPG